MFCIFRKSKIIQRAVVAALFLLDLIAIRYFEFSYIIMAQEFVSTTLKECLSKKTCIEKILM